MPRASLKHPKESFESLMRRFKRAVEKADVMKEVRSREAHEKPSETRKRAKAAAIKRWEKKKAESELPSRRPSVKAKKKKGRKERSKAIAGSQAS